MDSAWPDRLKEARVLLGASREQVASWSQVPVEVVAGAEAGEAISSTELELICRGLVVAPGAILSGGATDPKRTPAFFRTQVGPEVELSPNDLRTLQVVAQISRMVGHLAREMGMRPGIHLVEIELSPSLEGTCVWQPGGLPVVLRNRRARPEMDGIEGESESRAISPLLQGVAAEIVLEAAKANIISEGRCQELLAWR